MKRFFVSSSLFLIVFSLLSLTGCPEPPRYMLLVSVEGAGSVAPDPPNEDYESDTEVTLAATPAVGWQFDHWSGDLTGSDNPAVVTMDQDRSVIAVFTRIMYTLSVASEGQGTVASDPTGGIHPSGTEVMLAATPAAGWRFDHWTGDLSGNANPVAVTMDQAKSITAIFAEITHTLTITSEGEGAVGSDPAGGIYGLGTEVALTAIPAAGWQFDHWLGDLSGNTNPAVVTMDADLAVMAVFTRFFYSLTFLTAGQGSVSVDPSLDAYPSGTQVTLTAAPAPGWQYDHWSGDLSGNANPVVLTMDQEKTITAVFTQIFHSLSIAAQGEGAVASDPAGNAHAWGTEVSLTATPAAGWRFDHWTGDLTGTANPVTVTMDQDRSITAVFTLITFAVSVVAEGEGSVSLDPGGGTYLPDTYVTLTAIPVAGWQFDHWDGDLTGTTNPVIVKADQDKSVTAVFTQIFYTLTVTTEGEGTVTADPSGSTHLWGTYVTLTASAAEGWQFDHWAGDLTGNTNPTIVKMDQDRSIQAVFTRIMYTLSVSFEGEGAVTAEPSDGVLASGTEVELAASPSPGWRFDHWAGDLTGTANPAVFTMDESKSITAVFRMITYTLSVASEGEGTVSLDPPGGVYISGVQVELTATPAAGWQFDHWTGALSGDVNPVNVMMSQSKSVTAVFSRVRYTLSVVSDGEGTVTLDPPGGTYLFGTEVTLVATSSAQSRFVRWEGDLTGSANPAGIVVDGNKNVTAVFVGEYEPIMQLGYGRLTSTAVSPDGALLLTGSDDFKARLWDLSTGLVIGTFSGHSQPVAKVAFSSDGTKVLTGSYYDAKLWVTSTGECIGTYSGQVGALTSVALSQDGTMILGGGYDGAVTLWDVATGSILRTLTGHSQIVESVAFSPDGTKAATGSSVPENVAKLWDVASGECLRTFIGHTWSVNSVTFSSDGSQILTGSSDYHAKLWDVNTGTCLRTFTGHTWPVTSAGFSPDGTKVLTGSDDSTAKLWDVTSGVCVQTFTGHTTGVNSASFLPDGTRILTQGFDDTVRLWDVATGTCTQMLLGHQYVMTSVAFSPDGATILAGSLSWDSKLWDVTTGLCTASLEGHTSAVSAVAFSPDGAQAVTGAQTQECAARLWDVATRTCLRTYTGHTDALFAAAFSVDGAKLVTASADGTAKLWDTGSDACLGTFSGHADVVTSAAFSPDGTQVLTGSYDGTAKLWDVATTTCLFTFTGHAGGVLSAVFSPDATQILTGSSDTTSKLWDTSTGACVATLDGHTESVSSVAFSPDGTLILTGSYDDTARLWDATTAACLHIFTGHLWGVYSVAFSPDGTKILAAGADGALLWMWP